MADGTGQWEYFFDPGVGQNVGPFEVDSPAWVNNYNRIADNYGQPVRIPTNPPGGGNGGGGNGNGGGGGDGGGGGGGGGGGTRRRYGPQDAPTGSVYIIEDFTDTLTNHSADINHSNGLSQLVGSAEWAVLDGNPGRFLPGLRNIYGDSAPYGGTDTNPTAFEMVSGHPKGVPAASYAGGHYDCWHIGIFWTDGTTQQKFDVSAACKPPGTNPPPDSPPLVPPPPPNQNCGFYDCPSNTGTGSCCHDYTDVFVAIQHAIESIADKLTKTTTDACNVSDSCIQQIWDKIWQKITKVKKTCQQCCDDVRNGVAQTSEEAFVCASMECQCAEKECQPYGSTSADGSTCSNCNQAPCCCKDGKCEPCEPDEKEKYYAYCNSSSGLIYVSKTPVNLSDDYVFVGEYPTEAIASQAAYSSCYHKPDDNPPPIFIPDYPPPAIGLSPVCTIESYTTASGLASVLGGVQSAKIADFLLNAVQSSLNSVAESVQNLPLAAQLSRMLAAAASNPYLTGKIMSPYIQQLMGCDGTGIGKGVEALIVKGLIQQHVGVDLEPYLAHLDYALHATCRNKLLSPADAMSAFLANAITREQLDTYFAIQGFCPYEDGRMVEAARSKLTPLENAILLRRGTISNQEYANRIRALGFVRDNQSNEILSLTEQRPGMSDIIRFMVRDADDRKVVERFDLDNGFTDKYQEQLRQWGDDQGIPEQVARYAWRSHWSIPSPTALYQFRRRLRHKAEFNGNGQLEEDIKAALIQQDILPHWIPHFLAIANNPLTRVDVRRAFNLGSLTEQQVKESYWDQGYSDENADILTKFTVRLRDKSAVGHRAIKQWQQFKLGKEEARIEMVDDGLPVAVIDKAFKLASGQFLTSWPIRAFVNGDLAANEVRQELQNWGVDNDAILTAIATASSLVRNSNDLLDYAAGTITRDHAATSMANYGMSGGRANRLLDKVDAKFGYTQAMECTAAIKKRFLLGEYNGTDAKDALVKNGIVDERAQKLVNGWGCEKSSIGKAVPTAELCGWVEQGVITPLQFVKRLTNIGYTQQDAANILGDCQGKINSKQQKQVMADAKAEAAAVAKQQRRQQMAEAQLQREAKAIEAAGKKAKAARDRRTKQLANVIEKLYKKSYGSIYDSQQAANRLFAQMREDYALDQDQTLAAMLQGAEAYTASGNTAWETLTLNIAQGMVNKALEPDEVGPI